jgi:hypothetical protein
LAADDGIATICAYAQVKGYSDIRLRIDIPNNHRSIVKIDRKNLMFEKQTDIRYGGCLLKQTFVEKSAIY